LHWHIPYKNAKRFANDILLNHIGNEELKSFDGIGTGRMIKKDGIDVDGKIQTSTPSPPLIVIDPDDKPMWSSTRNVAPTPSSAIIQLPISNNFHIRGTHMQMIRENQFDGRIRSDPHRHVANFLEISNIFQYGENQEESVMLRTFLSRDSKKLRLGWMI
nr:reverse transcriptase domain-containing protein [Tanacetum cinerariifolium]